LRIILFLRQLIGYFIRYLQLIKKSTVFENIIILNVVYIQKYIVIVTLYICSIKEYEYILLYYVYRYYSVI
jgi:hypothetical protein